MMIYRDIFHNMLIILQFYTQASLQGAGALTKVTL